MLPYLSTAQDCRCCAKRTEGQTLFDKKRYEAAIEKWEYAGGLSDADKCPDIPALISKARQRIKTRDEAAVKARREQEQQRSADARQQADDDLWDVVRYATNAEPYERYLVKYPNGRHAADARRLRDQYKPKPAEPIKKDPPTKEPAAAVASFLVKIPGGTFAMGDQFGEGSSDELPLHNVTVSDFYMSRYEVSFDEFDAFCTATGRDYALDSGWGRGKRPAINVDWYDAVEYCNWLSGQDKLRAVYTIDKTSQDPNNKYTNDTKKYMVRADRSADGYRLPTEAEWEYAARAVCNNSGTAQGGGKVRFGNGSDILDPSEINFDARKDYKKTFSIVGEYRQQTVPVDELSANAFDLKNMSGNIWEWCWDWYDGEIYKNTEGARDPKGGGGGEYRVLRGGSWPALPKDCRASTRGYNRPDYGYYHIGFRVVRHL